MKFVEHRVGDRPHHPPDPEMVEGGAVFLEDEVVTVGERGTGQGSVISAAVSSRISTCTTPSISGANRWRRQEATGDMIIVRYADDIVLGFEHEADAHRFLEMMRAPSGGVRTDAASGENPPDRIRPPSGGAEEEGGLGKPGDLQLPGLHLDLRQVRDVASSCYGGNPGRDRLQASFRAVKEEMRRRMHQPEDSQTGGSGCAGWSAGGSTITRCRPTSVLSRPSATASSKLWLRSLRRRRPAG